MTECSSCKKIFDYEKYYGICPKCGTYNPRTSSQQNIIQQEVSQETATHQNAYEWENSGRKQGMKTKVPQWHRWLGILLLLGGILLTRAWLKMALKSLLTPKYVVEEDASSMETDNELHQKEEPGAEFELSAADIMLKVNHAKTVVAANSGLEGYPQQEKLIAVEISYSTMAELDYDVEHEPIGTPYVRYLDADGQFVCKEALPEYFFDETETEAYGNVLDIYKMMLEEAENDTGVYLFFVDHEATEVNFCISEWDTKKDEQIVVHDVVLELDKEESE